MIKQTPKALSIAIPAPLRRFFYYLPPNDCNINDLQPGIRVRVPFKKREVIGIFMGLTDNPDVPLDKLKSVTQIIDQEPIITQEIWQLCNWAADYYHYPVGEVFANALPTLLRKGNEAILSKKKKKEPEIERQNLNFKPNHTQQSAISAIQSAINTFQVFLLDGVTGSGKTEVYLQTIEKFLAEDKQILILVPEIGLTPQSLQRFKERFTVPIATLHSGLTEKERLNAWINAKSNLAKIIIGTRSAIFTPFANLGLIIVDEEHDLSFKQQDTFRYHARDLSIKRAHFGNFPIVLGSATPSLESLHNAKTGRYHLLRLPERAGNALLPEVKILNICKKPLEQGLSKDLLTEIAEPLKKGEQVVLFLNRRGFAPILMCHNCGYIEMCMHCDRRMTYHRKPEKLHCHHCESQRKIKWQCANCQENELIPIGSGTEKLEETLTKFFPDYGIARIDRDNTKRKGALEKLLTEIAQGKYQILIGTQMLAKGHHFPNVTLVAIVDADGGFFSTDFRALERMGQLLVQVGGRAGRAEKCGKVIIQTHHPDHPLLQQLLYEGYQNFAAALLKERNAAELPPYNFFALLRAEAHLVTHALEFLNRIKNESKLIHNSIKILGPIPAALARRAGRHRVQLLIQSKERRELQKFLKELLPKIEKIPYKHRVHWSLDVDPIEMV